MIAARGGAAALSHVMGPCVSGTSSLFLEYLLHYCDLSDANVEVVVWNGVVTVPNISDEALLVRPTYCKG